MGACSGSSRGCGNTDVVKVREGDLVPSATLLKVVVGNGVPSERVDIAEYCKGHRRIILSGCPGAFRLVCSRVQVQSFIEKRQELLVKGVSEVIFFSVNDDMVMAAWARDLKLAGSMIKFMADLDGEFTRALGLVLEDENAISRLGKGRCKRCAMIVEEGVIRRLNIASYSDDPVGEKHPQVACAEKLLSDLEIIADSGPPSLLSAELAAKLGAAKALQAASVAKRNTNRVLQRPQEAAPYLQSPGSFQSFGAWPRTPSEASWKISGASPATPDSGSTISTVNSSWRRSASPCQ